MYQFVDDVLYRKRPNSVKLKCIPWEDGLVMLAEIHGCICGSHIGSRALAGKAFGQGFFWPTALQDATALVIKCEACQFHSKKLHQPSQALQTFPLTCPFPVWGLDILDPFPCAVVGFEYLYVAIDEFTKWPEVEAVREGDSTVSRQVLQRTTLPFWCAKQSHHRQQHTVHEPHLHKIYPRPWQQNLLCFYCSSKKQRPGGKGKC